MWGGFFAIVVALLIMDLGLMHRREREISIRESLWFSFGYILVSLCFGAAVWHYLGKHAGKDFYTGYFIEKSLSIDNIFVMSLVFSHFRIPRRYQHPVLFWGILGVIMLRGALIGIGAMLVTNFHFILYFFGAFLIVTGIRMLFTKDRGKKTLEESKLLAWLRRHIPITPELKGKRFFVMERESPAGRAIRKATPLLIVLLFIELADVVFAVDSVPAVFAITTDPFIVYTSNIFAILGLRALYFALAAMLHRFTYLEYALGLVLVFIGAKVFLAPVYKITSGWSLGVTLGLLLGGILFSLYKTRKEP